MKISFADVKTALPKADILVFFMAEGEKLPAPLVSLDKENGGAVARVLKAADFKGKRGQHATATLSSATVLIAGLGEAGKFDMLAAQNLGGSLVPKLNALRAASASVIVQLPKGVDEAQAAARMAFGAALRAYRFDKYRTKQKPEDKPTLAALAFHSAQSKAANSAHASLLPLQESVLLTRDLVSEPANIIYPETLAEECEKLKSLGLEVTVLGEDEMHKLGMGALLGVGQGSARESLLVALRWNGGKKSAAPVAFVGKGVTFDTGGISIKPANGMEEMKWDMGGAATVIGVMRTLAARKAKVNAVGVIGLVENMPSGNAQRPGDVVTSASGQTIEVLNTDAEGRLVLADALWYTQKEFKPRLIIDLATLTGAIIVALGTSRAGLFSNDDTLSEQLSAVGKQTGEDVWRLPLAEVYDKQINSDIADMQNIGADREAGSITAAQFLQRFVNEGTPWAHLDIAGTAWTKKDRDTCPKGATAYGVQLLDTLVSEYYEG